MTVPNVHDKALQLIRIKGPVLPSQVNKELDTNIMFASAILSELVDNKVLRISSLKVGGSPLYYAPGQEYKLQQFADKLHPKEKEAYELLRQKLILKDDKLVPAIRAALRQINDFAKPLQVTVNSITHLFWKWYLLQPEEAEKRIREAMNIQLVKKPEAEAQRKVQPEPRKVEPEIQKKVQEITRKPEPVIEKKAVEKVQEAKPEPRRKEVQRELKQEKQEGAGIEEPKDKFFRKIRAYFDESRVQIVDFKVVRKESELEFTIKIPSTVGTLVYFCKAKNKRKINDGDLSSVYIQAQSKKMPVLFLTTGELTKKAKELLEKEFKNVSVKQI